MNEEKIKNKETPLKELREAAGLTQEQMARELNVALSTFRRWERGAIEPSLTRKEWTKFCSLLKVKFDDLPVMLSDQVKE
jgi:DNA-binding XRE family transcriptional regulator